MQHEQRLLLFLAGEPFRLFFPCYLRRTFNCSNFGCCRFPVYMYDVVVVDHLPPTQHSSTQSAPKKAATQVRGDPSATAQARRPSWQELACRRAFMQLASFSRRTNKSKSLEEIYPSTQKVAEAGMMREGHAFIHIKNKTQCCFSSCIINIFGTCVGHACWFPRA